eukprot:m.654482 g.654482  ORF g.654482 m.654482 type:complete len:52 (+) comp58412_c0_seq1:418-573(+)
MRRLTCVSSSVCEIAPSSVQLQHCFLIHCPLCSLSDLCACQVITSLNARIH